MEKQYFEDGFEMLNLSECQKYIYDNPEVHNVLLTHYLLYQRNSATKNTPNILIKRNSGEIVSIYTISKENRGCLSITVAKITEEDAVAIAKVIVEDLKKHSSLTTIFADSGVIVKPLLDTFNHPEGKTKLLSKEYNLHVLHGKEFKFEDFQNFELKEVEENDIEIASTYIHEFYLFSEFPSTLESARENILSNLKQKTRFLLVEKSSGRKIGLFCYREVDSQFVSIAHVYLPTHERGKGYGVGGTMLFCKLLFDKGYKTIQLYAEKSNPISNHVYSKVGFTLGGQGAGFLIL